MGSESKRHGPAALAGVAAALLLLTWSARGFSGYKIPVSAETSGGGRGSVSAYELTYTIGQSSPCGTSVGANSEISSGLVPMLSDLVPPTIFHETPDRVPARTSVEILAGISDSRSGVDTVRLFFREGGFYVFREKPMVHTVSNVYSATLPPSSVTERGLAYYIEATDNKGNVSRYPAVAPDSVLSLPVAFTDLASPALPAGEYRMVALPGTPTDGSPDTVLTDDLGFYGRKAWRLGRWNTQGCDGERCYDEYPSIEDFAPGRAFWLISTEPRTFDFSGLSVDLSRPYGMGLRRGWNQIAAPFGFTTDWLSASLSYGGKSYSIGDLYVGGQDTILVEDNLISYDGSYHNFQTQLVPWAGYWIYNSSNLDIDLLFNPLAAAQAASQAAGLASSSPPPAGRRAPVPGRVAFGLWIRVASPERGEHRSLAGMSPAASDAWDALDLHDPPAIGDYTRGVFLREDWGARSGRYQADVRRADPDGLAWRFVVESSGPDHPSIDLEPVGEMMPGWEIFLYDLDAGLRIDPGSLPYSFDVEPGRRFLLVAGTQDFIDAQEATGGVALRPGIVGAAPNPFGAVVRVTFFLPSACPTSLRVYSVDGRLVRTLGERMMERGVHTLEWDGESSSGRPAAPGLYFIRLEARGASQVRKVMRMTP